MANCGRCEGGSLKGGSAACRDSPAGGDASDAPRQQRQDRYCLSQLSGLRVRLVRCSSQLPAVDAHVSDLAPAPTPEADAGVVHSAASSPLLEEASDTDDEAADTVQCAADTVQCATDSVQCAADNIQCAADNVQCAATNNVQFAATNSVQCAADTVQCAATNSVQCAATNSVQCAATNSVQCAAGSAVIEVGRLQIIGRHTAGGGAHFHFVPLAVAASAADVGCGGDSASPELAVDGAGVAALADELGGRCLVAADACGCARDLWLLAPAGRLPFLRLSAFRLRPCAAELRPPTAMPPWWLQFDAAPAAVRLRCLRRQLDFDRSFGSDGSK